MSNDVDSTYEGKTEKINRLNHAENTRLVQLDTKKSCSEISYLVFHFGLLK